MEFRTQIPVQKGSQLIDYHSKIVSLGSCFAVNIGEKFDHFKFQSTTNPFGIIFNPVSIEKLVSRIVQQRFFTDKDVFFHNDRWHCFEVHPELSNADKVSFIANLNKLLEQTYIQISEATHIIITYGTAWVYRENDHYEVVANCHKLPQSQFNKELLSVADCQTAMEQTIACLSRLNPNVSIIFTISPVRHIKDGFVENQLSKAHLLTALHAGICRVPSSSYFPSYEIMMDELRDYRFYASDMLHPNPTAIDYIWQVFANSWIAANVFPVMQEVENIQKSLNHRPFDADSTQHLNFLAALQQRVEKLGLQFPHIQFH